MANENNDNGRKVRAVWRPKAIPRIEFLKQRQREVQEQLAAEQMKQRRRMEKDNARLFRIVGSALAEHAAQSPDGFGLMLRQVLDTAVTDSKQRDFLRQKGMI